MANQNDAATGDIMSRRQVLTASVASSAAALSLPSDAMAGAVADLERLKSEASQILSAHLFSRSAELETLIAAYVKLKAERDIVEAEWLRLWRHPENPDLPGIKLADHVIRQADYSPKELETSFSNVFRIAEFYQAKLQTVPKNCMHDWRERLSQDEAILTDQYEAALQRKREWNDKTGINKLDVQCEEMGDRCDEIEDQIGMFACQSFGDVVLKLEFAREWLPLSDDRHYAISHDYLMQSIFDFLPRFSY